MWTFGFEIFKEFKDPLCIKPGHDHPDAIGTEFRPLSLYHPISVCPLKFRKALEHDR